MAKKYYEIGLMARVSPVEFDYETIDWEEDFERVADARREAVKLSKKCPFKDYHGRQVDAIQITCHSDEPEISSYYLHWSELYEGGKMTFRINY